MTKPEHDHIHDEIVGTALVRDAYNVPMTPSDVIGERLRQRRRQEGLSVEAVAALCKNAGAPELTANAIYLIEGGRRKRGDGSRRTRKIIVDELLILARVLEVSPLALLFPADSDEYPLTPGLSANVFRVYDWMIGRADSPVGEQDPDAPTWFPIPAGLPKYLVKRERRTTHHTTYEITREEYERGMELKAMLDIMFPGRSREWKPLTEPPPTPTEKPEPRWISKITTTTNDEIHLYQHPNNTIDITVISYHGDENTTTLNQDDIEHLTTELKKLVKPTTTNQQQTQ
jgi:transcriptional regulator with XRE-family HTH domain